MSGVVKQISNRRSVIDGERHRGWLPADAAQPPLTPEIPVTLNLTIEKEGEGGFLLVVETCDRTWGTDTWHPTVQEAIEQAEYQFGIAFEEWAEA